MFCRPHGSLCPARDVAVSSKSDDLRCKSRWQESNDARKEDDEHGDSQDPEGSGQEAASGQACKDQDRQFQEAERYRCVCTRPGRIEGTDEHPADD